MYTYGLAFTAVILIACVDRYLLTHADASCLDCLEALPGPGDRNKVVLTEFVLDREYKRIDEKFLTEAFEIIDRHLRRSIDTSDFATNIREVRALLRAELKAKLEAKSGQGTSWWSRLWRRECLSEQLSSKSRGVMVNALMRLLKLDQIEQKTHACYAPATEELSECNRVAKDSIGRRSRNDPFLLPRIDNMLFDAALRRADRCLPFYQGELRSISRSADSLFALVHEYWSQILERRFKAANFGGQPATVVQIFQRDPQGALNLVKRMPFAIEEDEVEVAKRFLDTVSQRRSFTCSSDRVRTVQHKAYLRTPCSHFIGMAKSAVDSLDFDLQMEQFIASGLMDAIRADGAVHRMRAYYSMCTKLVNQVDHNLLLLAPDER